MPREPQHEWKIHKTRSSSVRDPFDELRAGSDHRRRTALFKRLLAVMKKTLWLILLSLLSLSSKVHSAAFPQLTACGIVTAADAQRLVGGPLDVKEFAKIQTANGPGAYD